jgi:hypothetical protein
VAPPNLRLTRKIDQQLLSKVLIDANTHHLLSVPNPVLKRKPGQKIGRA